MVSSLSASFLANYEKYVSSNPNKLTAAEMFKSVSELVGGNGSTITKDELNSYISSAEENSGSGSSSVLSGLKTLQLNWDTISGGKDSISASNMSDYTPLLASIFSSSIVSNASTSATTDTSTEVSSTDKAYTTLIEGAVSKSTKSDLTSLLKTLLIENSNENDNSNDIDKITSLLAAFNGTSSTDDTTVEELLSSITTYTA